MKVAQTINFFNDYHRMNSKKNTIENYEFVIPRFQSQFQLRELESITSDEILSFLSKITDGTKQSTKKQRYSLLKAFFNFVIDTIDPLCILYSRLCNLFAIFSILSIHKLMPIS